MQAAAVQGAYRVAGDVLPAAIHEVDCGSLPGLMRLTRVIQLQPFLKTPTGP